MSTLMIRNIEARVKEQLRVRAARRGHSMEAELRQILKDALASEESREPEPNLAEAIRRRFLPLGGVDELAFPEDVHQVEIIKIGQSRLVSPVGKRWDDLFAAGPRASDDFMSERE